MAAYALIELEITDMAGMAPYVASVADTLAAHGGKYLVRLGLTEVAEGGVGEYPSKVVLEFASVDAAARLVRLSGIPSHPPPPSGELEGEFRVGGGGVEPLARPTLS